MSFTPDQIKALYVIAAIQGAVVLFMAVQAWLDARARQLSDCQRPEVVQ